MSLPKFMILKSDASGKYLSYSKGEGSIVPSSLSFSHEMKHPTLDADFLEPLEKKKGESFKTPAKMTTELHLLKFEVEEAKSAMGFVHIRTCYNNKYLVRLSEGSYKIAAEAHEAEEDQSKWHCTLFKPIFLGDVDTPNDDEDRLFGNKHGIGMIPQKIQLIHVASQHHVHMGNNESMELTSATATTLTVSDVEPTATLPKLTTFRIHNGKYLGTPNGDDLWFWYSDIGSEGVAMGVVLNSFIVSNKYRGHYWRVNQNSDVGLDAYHFSQSGDPMTFYPVKVNNFIALYAPDYGKFISHKYDDGVTAQSRTIIDDAKFEVVEPVLSRTIVSITYDLENARVYGTSDITKITDSRTNNTDHGQTGSLTREFTMTRTMTWNQSVTVSVGIAMGMSFGVPEVGFESKVDVNFNISETCAWGEEKTKTETVSHTYNFDIPPKTNQTKTVLASKSYCDVRFSCVVRDLLTDGSTSEYTTYGVFTGANEYNIVEETNDKPI